MKKKLKLSFYLLLAILVLSGCNKSINDEDLFNYKGSYVGDASAVGNILNNLPVTGYTQDFELKTEEAPYGIVLNYDGSESVAEQKEIIIYSATYLFALIQNVEWVQYNFSNQHYKITKQEINNWYGEDLESLKSEDELNAFIKSHLNSSNNLELLFNK